jgi:hypothetical protein
MSTNEKTLVNSEEVMAEGANHAFFLCEIKKRGSLEIIFGNLQGQNSRWFVKESIPRIKTILITGRLQIKEGVINLTLHSIDRPRKLEGIIEKMKQSMQAAGLHGKANLVVTEDLLPISEQRKLGAQKEKQFTFSV